MPEFDDRHYCRVCRHPLGFVKYVRGEETGDRIPLYLCKNCHSYFSRINYRYQTLNDIDNNDSIDGYLQNETYLKKRVRDIFSHVLRNQWLPNNNLNMLDIGCGVGWSLVIAKEMGFSACGVEPMTEAAKYATDTLKLDVINSLFKSDLFTEEDFDFIMMDQVLEHVPNPAETLADVFRLLKPGGILFLGVPPIDWGRRMVSMSFQLPIRINDLVKHMGKLIDLVRKYDTFSGPEGHVNYFSTKAISILAEKCNAQLLGQYHKQKGRMKYFPLLKLSTGSFFLRK